MSAEFTEFQPSGYDRATGIGGLPGTPTPGGVILYKNNAETNRFFEEQPDSPNIERAEQTTIVHRFNVDKTTGLTYIQALQRGQMMTDSEGNLTKILSSNLDYQKGDRWTLSITAEGFGGLSVGGGVSTLDIPPDEFNVETLEFNPSIYRHPRYNTVIRYNLDSNGNIINPSLSNGYKIVNAINLSANAPQIGTQTANGSLINSTTITDPDVLALANELLNKVKQGEDTFYLAGFKVNYTVYYYYPIGLNPGGYIEDPVDSGNLPYYFWSLDGTPDDSDSNNCFLAIAQSVAPQFYANGLSWLRQADRIELQRTWFKKTSIWIGGPYGNWDAQIYSPTPPPPPP